MKTRASKKLEMGQTKRATTIEVGCIPNSDFIVNTDRLLRSSKNHVFNERNPASCLNLLQIRVY